MYTVVVLPYCATVHDGKASELRSALHIRRSRSWPSGAGNCGSDPRGDVQLMAGGFLCSACDLLLFNAAMSGRAAWEDAWERALPHIPSLRTSLATNPIVSRVTRVGKLDSELLDQELVQLLEEPLKKAFALLNVSIA